MKEGLPRIVLRLNSRDKASTSSRRGGMETMDSSLQNHLQLLLDRLRLLPPPPCAGQQGAVDEEGGGLQSAFEEGEKIRLSRPCFSYKKRQGNDAILWHNE